jgi:hypothetical protein
MTAEELRRAAIALFGERGWMSRLAEALEIDRSTVSRWFGGLPVPGPAAAAVKAWLELRRLKTEMAALIGAKLNEPASEDEPPGRPD